MLSTLIFFIFFSILTVCLYPAMNRVKNLNLKVLWLLLVSYLYCLLFGVLSLLILLCTTVISYCMGLLMDRMHQKNCKKGYLLLCLYTGIFCCILPLLLNKFERFHLTALIGVSFYTLQEIGYLIDIYYKKEQAERNFFKYALFIAFFTKLVSGPIERGSNLLKQISDEQNMVFDYDRVKSGLLLMLWGYFQKSVIADSFAHYINSVYEQWESYSGITLIFATVLFAFQLYADFAGYTNLALGAAQVLGFKLQQNFIQPYLALSVKDFWRRWHCSLSMWLRDYIYIPLGGSRKGRLLKYLNLLITFLVSGLWHGTSRNFIAWGILHGSFLTVEDFFRQLSAKRGMPSGKSNPWKRLLQGVGVFILVDIAWIFFKASSLKAALGILAKCLLDISGNGFVNDVFYSLNLNIGKILLGIIFITLILVIDILHEKGFRIRPLLNKQPVPVRWVCYLGLLLLLTFVEIRRCGIEASNFIYMQF